MNPTEPRYSRNPSVPEPGISTVTPSRPRPGGGEIPDLATTRTPSYPPNPRVSHPARPIERPSRPQPYPPMATPLPIPPTAQRRSSSMLRRVGIALICLLILVTAVGLVVEGFIITTGSMPFGG